MSDPNFEIEDHTPCMNGCGENCEKDYCSENCWNQSNN